MNVRLLGFVALLSRLALGATPPPEHPLPVSFDVDRDGVQDVIQPSPQYNDMIPLAGRVRVVSGTNHHTLLDVWSQQNNDLFGFAASSAGDLNGDGRAELIVGAPWATSGSDTVTRRGRVDIFDGAEGMPIANIMGWSGCRHLGRSVAGLGDVDGDGIGDIAIGHHQQRDDVDAGTAGAGSVGAVSIVSGRTGALLSRLVSDRPNDGFGASIGGVGDVTGDNRADILVSAPWRRDDGRSDDPGAAYLFTGVSDGVTRGLDDATITISNPGIDRPGVETRLYARQLAPAFDVDGDGRRDLLIVSVGRSAAGQHLYDVRVHQSVDGTTLRIVSLDRLRLPTDLNFDHVVDHEDQDIVHANLGDISLDETPARADVDRDGFVGLSDLSIVFDAFDQQTPLDGVVAQPMLDPQDDPWVEPFAPGFEVDPFEPCFGPLRDCDRDGIPNVNDPDSDWYDPRHPCSWILEDCDGDDVPNWLDDDWWFYFFREPDPDACADAIKDGYDFPGDVPWDHIPAENNPLHPCYDKRHPFSDPDRDGQPNNGDHDDDGDGIPDEIDEDPYCPCDTGACGVCDYPSPPPGDDAPPPFDDDDDGSGGGGGGGGGRDECDVDIHLTYSFAALPTYIDVHAGDLWIFARGGDTDYDWSWSIEGPGAIVVDPKDPRYACVNPTGMGTITVTAHRGCSASWDLHTVDTDLVLLASSLSHPETSQQIYLLPVNADDDDADDIFDWDITDTSIDDEDDGRDASLAPLDGEPLMFDESAWTMWHDGTVRVWYPMSGVDLRRFAFNGPWPDPLDRFIDGALYRALPAGEYIIGLPLNERTLLVEAILPTFEYGESHLGYTIWSTYQQDHDDNPETSDVLRAMTINRPVFASLMNIDIDLDSDNDQAFDSPDRSATEEWQEALVGDPQFPGKTVVADTVDTDRDGVTDFADGYDRLPDPFFEDDLSIGTRFVPVVIEAAGIRVTDTSLVIDYNASDPLAIDTNADALYVLPEGSMRLWRDDGDARRDGRSIDDGGSYIPPGIHTLANLMDGTGDMSVTLYLEVLRPSVVPGDLPVSITFYTRDAALPEFTDTANVNGVLVELQAMNFDSTAWQYAEGVIGTTTSSERNDGVLSDAAWQIYTLSIHDARGSSLTEITIDDQQVPVYFNGQTLVTPPFVCDAGDLLGPAPVPDVITLNGDGIIELAYNPTWVLPSATGMVPPRKHEKQLAELLISVPEEMFQEGWIPENPRDSGAYGKEVHRRISEALSDDVRWVTDVFVDSETNEIVSIGAVPPGGREGSTEIDILRLKRGYRPEVGDILDPERVDDLYEIKTSISGRITDDQRVRLRNVMDDGEIKLGVTARRWTPVSGWHTVRRVQNIARVLGLVGAAAVAYTYLVPESAMADYDLVAAEYDDLEYARNRTSPDELEIMLEAAEVVQATRAYLTRFVEDPAIVDLITQLAIYRAMDGDD